MFYILIETEFAPKLFLNGSLDLSVLYAAQNNDKRSMSIVPEHRSSLLQSKKILSLSCSFGNLKVVGCYSYTVSSSVPKVNT